MSNNIKTLLGVALVVGTTFAATIPADAARRNHYRGSSDYYGYNGPSQYYGGPPPAYRRPVEEGTAGWPYVPQGEFTGYPPWARAALAPKH